MTHEVRFTRHDDGYIAWVSGQRVGFMRRELKNHPRRIGASCPGTWRCWRIYQNGEPVAAGDNRKAVAIKAWEIQKARQKARREGTAA